MRSSHMRTLWRVARVGYMRSSHMRYRVVLVGGEASTPVPSLTQCETLRMTW